MSPPGKKKTKGSRSQQKPTHAQSAPAQHARNHSTGQAAPAGERNMNPSRREKLRDVSCQKDTHVGLWLDSYLRQQTRDGNDSEDVKQARMALLREASDTIVDWSDYRRAAEKRKQSFSHNRPGWIREIRFYKTQGRCIVGLGQKGVIESGISLERTWGAPILPGSSLKGLAAATAHLLTDSNSWKKAVSTRQQEAGESFQELFGSTAQKGRVIFHDAWWLPEEDEKKPLAQDIVTVHYPSYYQGKSEAYPDTFESPIPNGFLTTRSGLVFLIVLEAREEDRAWLDSAWELLEKGLSELGIGAKTNASYGRLIKDEGRTEKFRQELERQELQQQIGQGQWEKVFPVLCKNLGAAQTVYDGLRNKNYLTKDGFPKLLAKDDHQELLREAWKDQSEENIKNIIEQHFLKTLAQENEAWRKALLGEAQLLNNISQQRQKELGQDLGFLQLWEALEAEQSQLPDPTENREAWLGTIFKRMQQQDLELEKFKQALQTLAKQLLKDKNAQELKEQIQQHLKELLDNNAVGKKKQYALRDFLKDLGKE